MEEPKVLRRNDVEGAIRRLAEEPSEELMEHLAMLQDDPGEFLRRARKVIPRK